MPLMHESSFFSFRSRLTQKLRYLLNASTFSSVGLILEILFNLALVMNALDNVLFINGALFPLTTFFLTGACAFHTDRKIF